MTPEDELARALRAARAKALWADIHASMEKARYGGDLDMRLAAGEVIATSLEALEVTRED